MNRIRFALLAGLIAVLSYSTSLLAQEQPQPLDSVRINTNVVFLDALVRDRRTGVPVTDLRPENFEVLDDGQPRSISYFTREGQSRKPLALVLMLDISGDGAGRFLRRTEIIEAIAAELAKLPSDDEIGVMALDSGMISPRRMWITGFTRDRAQLKAALLTIPDIIHRIEMHEFPSSDQSAQPNNNSQGRIEVSIGTNSSNQSDAAANASHEGERVTTIPSKKKVTVTRTERPDGTVVVHRVSRGCCSDIVIDDRSGLTVPIQDVIRRAASDRPNSQPAMIWISDGLTPIVVEERGEAEALLLRSNVMFSALTTEMKTNYKIFLPFLRPLTSFVGMSLYGSAQRLAKQTGGESIKVHGPEDYGRALSRIVGNMTARYNLGFTLSDTEADDGRMHQLDVRVRATDARGKTRKLDVTARRGYFVQRSRTETASAQ